MFSSISKALRNNVLVGLVLITPLVVTVWIVNLLFNFITRNALFSFLSQHMPEAMRDSSLGQALGKVLGLVFVLMILFLIGFFARSFFGRKLYRLGEMFVERIPVFNKIYIWIRQISESFIARRQTLFKEVVLVEYPRIGLYSVAFVTAPVPADFSERHPGADAEEFVALFIPTTPNPTSGLMIVAPRRDLRPLDISVADAMKFIISAGAVHPGDRLVDDRPTLVDKLEQWITREA